MLPKGSARRAAAGKIARAVGIPVPSPLPPGHPHYQYWIENVEPYMFGPSIAPTVGHRNPSLPVFSIVVSVYDGTLERYLFALITSITNQTYAHWELVIADATQLEDKKSMVARYVGTDHRIRAVRVPQNQGISGNTNHALSAAQGTFVVFADHDDTLSPHALNEFALALRSQSEAVLLYSDEDKLSDDGDRRLTPHFKADWSPDLLHNVNYITHLTAIRRDVLTQVGLLRSECDGAQDFDLLLRVIAHLGVPVPGDPRIVHVPKVLYHWRLAETSTAANFSVKSEALDAGVLALTDHFRSTGRNVTVAALANRPGFYRVRHQPDEDDRVALVLVGIADTSVARARLDRIARRTNLSRISRIVTDADVGSTLLASTGFDTSGSANGAGSSSVPIERIGSIADLIDCFAWRSMSSKESAVMILAGNATPEAGDWADDLLGALMQPHVFAVSPRVVSPSRQIVDCGLVDIGGQLVPLVLGTRTTDSVFGSFEWVRDVDALSGRALMCRTDDFVALVGAQINPSLRSPIAPESVREAAEAKGMVNLVWSHTTFMVTGSTDPSTRFGNPQIERLGGAIIPTRGFDASFNPSRGAAW